MYYGHDDRDILFYRGGDLNDHLNAVKNQIKADIQGLGEDYILNVNEEDLINSFVQKYTISLPVLKKDDIYSLGSKEVDVDVSNDNSRLIMDRDRPFYIKGTSITIVIPFEGEPDLFHFTPSTRIMTSINGTLNGNELHLTYTTTSKNPDEIKNSYGSHLQNIENTLSYASRDVNAYNSSLRDYIISIFRNRKQKLLDDRNLVSALNIPVKKREGAGQTFSVPIARKKILVELPKVNTEKFQPEPTIAMNVYEEILNTMEKMSSVIEQSPNVYSKMGEEEIRNIFLVGLNDQYGEAGGETFNYQGKTDILIKNNGGNVFVAECKFWKGEQVFLDTISQLLGYTTWRDTKTAILVFNKNKNLSQVLAQITSTAQKHKNYKKEQNISGETKFRFVFTLPQDSNREVIITILVFDIPQK